MAGSNNNSVAIVTESVEIQAQFQVLVDTDRRPTNNIIMYNINIYSFATHIKAFTWYDLCDCMAIKSYILRVSNNK